MSLPDPIPKSPSVARVLLRRVFAPIGGMGLGITVAMNLIALLVFRKASAEFLSPAWWSSWFTCYVVWAVFLVLGAAGFLMRGP
jgi:hypothetical protein